MAAFFPRIAALVALSASLLAARSARAQSAPQPYAPYAPQPYAAPAWAGRAPVMTERQSPGMMAAGIVLITVGSAGSIAGAALLAAGTTSSYVYPPCPPTADCFPSRQTKPGLTAAGATVVAVSTAALIAGIPMLAVGLRKVPVRAALVPELRVGAGGGALRWQF